ncbi:NAD(P)/FAD-dependent oxidoreductase [Nocardioides sp. MH1]|uniref:NAD(P)/FAD-dependent oxidoreductase n=1 Tax=Nocardioides sp. MH1 TaxID=3242490 RepID=UPI00352071B6
MSDLPETPQQVVVLGGGLAAARAVEELRERGYDGVLTLVGAEPHLPYERPPLSKGLLLGSDDVDSVFVHEPDWYDDKDVDLRLGAPARRIDRGRRVVVVGDDEIPYDRLLVATGAQPRRLPALDGSGIPVAYLRTLDDALALKEALGGDIAVVGAGWIGLEVAAAARTAGASVTVVESAPLPLQAVLGPELAPVFADLHRSHGVDLRLGTSVDQMADGTLSLSDGTRLRPDLVVVGIGAAPDDHLAAESGLDTDNGILVDARLRTTDPAVWAAGDVANHDHPALGRLRVEHWDNAIKQGRHAAGGMLGDDAPYEAMPYFFTDQYDLGMEYVGHVGRAGHDEVVVRGDLGKAVFTAFWLKDDRVVAGMQANDWDASDHLRRLVGGPVPDGLRDPARDLGDL